MLRAITVLYDTREQETDMLYKRLFATGYPFKKQKLDFGDYSCETISPNGEIISCAKKVAIERKMSLDELCNCFTSGRERFEQEMQRAKEAEAKLYLLVENATWEKALNGKYRSKLNPISLTGSLLSWSAKYDLSLFFCKAETSGNLIGKILRYELRRLLEEEAV